MVYRPHPRRQEGLTICRCHYKGSAFPSVISRPRVLFRPRFQQATSRSTNQRLSIELIERRLTHLDWVRIEIHDSKGQEKRRAAIRQFLSQ